jgi:hypothetical protein
MTFATPIGLLLLSALPVIVLLHLFRQERRRELVSSLFLWRDISDQSSRRIRPRLLRNIHLLLQLLAVIAAAFALSEPALVRSGISGADQLIIVVDTSASMQSVSDGESSFEQAVERARSLAAASRSERTTIIGTGLRPSVYLAPTTSLQSVNDALDAMVPTAGGTDLNRLADLISGLEGGGRSEVVFLTDAAGAAEITSFERWGPDYLVEQHGAPGANRGITSFELRERPDGTGIEMLIGVANFSNTPANVELVLTADQERLTTEQLALAPGEERMLTTTVARTTGVFRAELSNNVDALAVDDQAFASSRGERPIRVQLVTRGNLFLESFFSIFPQTELTVTEEVEDPLDYDLIVLDRLPAPARLRGNVLAIGTAIPDGPFTPEETVQITQALSTLSHPITTGAQLEQVQVERALAGTIDQRATVLASAGNRPLIYSWRTESLTLVGFLFSLRDSDIALRGSFPILMSNIIEWLAPTGQTTDAGYVQSGTAVPLYVPPGEEIVIIKPDETPMRFTPRQSPFEFAETEQAGLYRVRGESFTSTFAVSMADSDESQLIPAAEALITTTSGGFAETTDTERAGRPLWHLFALAALLLLATDWIIWARRT